MISGFGTIYGIVKLKIKIFRKTKKVSIFILEEDFEHDFLIGLDLIKAFYLCQDEKLKIFQNFKPKYSERELCQLEKPVYVNFVEKINIIE